jgi:hypothetical protein
MKFEETFAALRAVLAPHATHMRVTVDRTDRYELASQTMVDRVGKPLFCAAVQINKNYVSYHLMPLYMHKPLLESVSPSLRRRMQGKACFNFTTVDPDALEELGLVTTRGIAAFKDFKLPWSSPASRPTPRGSARTRVVKRKAAKRR